MAVYINYNGFVAPLDPESAKYHDTFTTSEGMTLIFKLDGAYYLITTGLLGGRQAGVDTSVSPAMFWTAMRGQYKLNGQGQWKKVSTFTSGQYIAPIDDMEIIYFNTTVYYLKLGDTGVWPSTYRAADAGGILVSNDNFTLDATYTGGATVTKCGATGIIVSAQIRSNSTNDVVDISDKATYSVNSANSAYAHIDNNRQLIISEGYPSNNVGIEVTWTELSGQIATLSIFVNTSEFLIVRSSTLTELANTVRAKIGSTSPLSLEQMTTEIGGIGTEEIKFTEYIAGDLTEYSNNDITKIADYRFYSDSTLTSVSFPACISIGNSAFGYCSKLSSINLTNCTSVGSCAFYSCNSLTSVSFPACISVGNSAFGYCGSLTSVSFLNLNSLATSMFTNCSNLTDVNIPSCTTIAPYAFMKCSKLQSISIPKVTTLSSYAFAGCSSLKSISLPRVNATGTYVFQSCYQLTDVDFSFGAVGTGTFQYCSALASVNLTGCSVIYSYAFQGCNSLTNIDLPRCISIYNSAFQNCKSLSSVNLSKCNYIASNVFNGCTNLTTLVLQSTSICSLYRSNAFTSTPIASKTGYIFVPSGLVSLYKSASYWSYFSTQIVALDADIRVPGPIEDSWETISEISKSGNAEDNYLIGDTKDITLTTGEVITLQIIGFNHDTLSDGTGTAGITFQMKNCLANGYSINASNSNSTGWSNSLMRTRLQPNGEIYEALPDDVKSIICPVNKITSIGSLSTTLETTSDYIFLLSEIEICGNTSYSVSGEGSQYTYYKNGGSKIKYLANGSGNTTYWWTRSPSDGGNRTWVNISNSGGNNSQGSCSNSDGVSFAFCI